MVSGAATPFTELSFCVEVGALPSEEGCCGCVFPEGCWEADGEEGREEKELGPLEEGAGEGELGILKGSFSGGLATMREVVFPDFERERCAEFKGEQEGLGASKGDPCLIVEREDALKSITPFAPG